MPKKQQEEYPDTSFEPDVDMPDTSEADKTLEDALGGDNGAGIGKISTLHAAEKGYKDYTDYQSKQDKARADAAKSMQRDSEDGGGV